MDISRPIDPADLFSARDLVVVITGGGSGIGLAFAAALARSKAAKVYLLGRRLQLLQDAASSIDPHVVRPIQCDVTSPDSIATAVQNIEKETHYIDVLINNAGISGPPLKHKEAKTIQDLQAMMQKDWPIWNKTWETNTSSVVAVSSAFLHLLDAGNKRNGWVEGKRDTQLKVSGDVTDMRSSQIITITSIAAFNREPTAGAAYLASKAGSTAIGKSLSYILAPFGIRSNVIAPGRFPSEMTAGAATTFPIDQVPAGKSGEYEDMAAVILYLVGKSGAYVNGNVQIVDGGRLSVMPAMY
ncbi:MAG: hypothetical protein M1822_004471 [Bathelium mastoideum]|nr:MAG: hypothetical protein M1822_004471 [Bathelium mastoideum]